MKTKRILALLMCTLMMFASFGMNALASAPSEIGGSAIYGAAFDKVNTYGVDGTYIGFMSTAPASMSFTLGVTQTGYYNIQTILRNHAYKAEALKNDVYITTYRGDTVQCDPNGFSSDGSTYANPLETVYLEKGDRVVTLHTEMTSDEDPADDYLRVRLYGIKLDLVEAVTGEDGDDTGSDNTNPGQIKNIIYMIPDGGSMASFNLADAVKEAGGFDRTKAPYATQQTVNYMYLRDYLVGAETTYSASDAVTDSAAAGTALAGGYKTTNNYLGIDPNYKPHATLLEAAQYVGKKTGLVATYEFANATPAAFSSHESFRNDYTAISQQMANQDIDVVLGGGFGKCSWDEADEYVESQGYTLIDNKTELAAVKKGDKIWGNLFPKSAVMDHENTAESSTIAEMTSAAIRALENDEEGFFLMVEGSKVDNGGHTNDAVDMIGEYIAFDEACKVAIEWAKKRTDTVVIALPDHDTGGLNVHDEASAVASIRNCEQPSASAVTWDSKSHTARNGGVFMYVPEGVDYIDGLSTNPGVASNFDNYVIDNTAVAPYLAGLMGVDLDEVTDELFVDVTSIGTYVPTGISFVDAFTETTTTRSDQTGYFTFNNINVRVDRNFAEATQGSQTIDLDGQVSVYENGRFYVPKLLLDTLGLKAPGSSGSGSGDSGSTTTSFITTSTVANMGTAGSLWGNVQTHEGATRIEADETFNLAAGGYATFSVPVSEGGIYYLQIKSSGGDTTLRTEVNDYYYAELPVQSAEAAYDKNADGEYEFLYLPKGYSTVKLMNTGDEAVTVKAIYMMASQLAVDAGVTPTIDDVKTIIDYDNVETEPTVSHQLVNDAMTGLVTESTGVTIGTAGITFIAGKPGTAKIKIGVPQTGYYKVQVNTNVAISDLSVTTDRGDTAAFANTGSSYWNRATSDTLYFVKGDRIITVATNGMTTADLYAIRLVFDHEGDAPSTGGGDNTGSGDTSDEPTAPSTMSGQTLADNTSDMQNINTTWASTYLAFSSAGASSATVTVGVPETGYYNVQAVYRNHNGSYKQQALITDLYVKTESDESFSYDKEKVQYTDYTVYADAPETVYLEKGDRKLTFYNTEAYPAEYPETTGCGTRLYAINLKLVEAAPEPEEPKPEEPSEDTETEPNVASQLVNETLTAQVTETSGATVTSSYIQFAPGSTAKVKIGVPQTGYYNVQTASNAVMNGMTVATGRGDSAAFISTGSDYWNSITSSTIYLVKGDRILTFGGNASLLLYSARVIFDHAGDPPSSGDDGDITNPDTETAPTMNTVVTPAQDAAFVAQITETDNVTKNAATADFTAGTAGSFKIKVGVPATGYYNVSALIKASDGTANLDTDLTLTTDRGDSFTYGRTTRGGSWTYAPQNVYLVKGDRILTFSSDMTGSKGIIMSGIRLYHMTKAFYGIKDVEVEIPLDEDSITVTAGELLATDIGVAVDSSKVVMTAEGATLSQDMSDWSKSTITFPEEGDYTITIKDDFYGGVTTITVPVTKEEIPLDPDIETIPTLDTVANPLMHEAMINQITKKTNATQQGTELFFMGGKDNTVKIKVGVPETGYYNVAAILRSNDGAAVLYNDLTLTTDRGDSFTYPRATRGGNWTYAPANVYLVKGDRILTFHANMTSGAHTIMSGIRLYHVTAAFGSNGDLTYTFAKDEEAAVTVTAGDLFSAYIGVTDINSANVELTAPGATVVKNTEDWTQSTISFSGLGKYEVKIKDDFFGTVVKTTVSIKREPSLEISEFTMLSEDGIRIPYAINDHLTPYAHVTVTKLKDDMQTAYIVFAEYSDDNKLMSMNMQPVDVTTMVLNESKAYAVPLSLKGKSGEVKAFVLGEDFEPLGETGGYTSEDIFTKDMLNKEVTYQLATETLDPNGNYYTEPGLHNNQYDIDAIFYDGSVYNGRQTKVFAYIGIPKTATPENPVPAVVCVHGGWGKAEASWVKKWNDRGYAAISMDLYGNGPVSGTNNPDDHTGKLAHPYKGMYPWDDYGTAFLKDYEHAGMYHAVQNVINAHSLIRSLDKVDASRTGITGISWGGITTTIVSGVDDRFKFAAPIYGCGYLDEAVTYFQTAFDGDNKTDKWDPSNFAAAAKMPVLYTNGDMDVHFSINSSSLTYEYTPNAYLSIHHGLAHGQGTGDSIEQVYDFAEKIFGGSTQPFMAIENETFANNVLTFDYTAPAGVTVSSVKTYYITNATLPAGGGEAFVWSGVSAYTNSNGKISVTLPEAATFCYASVTDSEGNIISTKLMAK